MGGVGEGERGGRLWPEVLYSVYTDFENRQYIYLSVSLVMSRNILILLLIL